MALDIEYLKQIPKTPIFQDRFEGFMFWQELKLSLTIQGAKQLFLT